MHTGQREKQTYAFSRHRLFMLAKTFGSKSKAVSLGHAGANGEGK
jgi:hypothetical protein